MTGLAYQLRFFLKETLAIPAIAASVANVF